MICTYAYSLGYFYRPIQICAFHARVNGCQAKRKRNYGPNYTFFGQVLRKKIEDVYF